MERGARLRRNRCLTADARAHGHRHLLHLLAVQRPGSLLRPYRAPFRGDGSQRAGHPQHLLKETGVEQTVLTRMNDDVADSATRPNANAKVFRYFPQCCQLAFLLPYLLVSQLLDRVIGNLILNIITNINANV